MHGKGAFRVRGDEDPVRLAARATTERGQSVAPDKPRSRTESRPQTGQTLSYNALTMCLLAEGEHAIKSPLENTMEWHTAAAQAVVSAIGIKVTSCETGEQLTYNKEGFSNNCIIIG